MERRKYLPIGLISLLGPQAAPLSLADMADVTWSPIGQHSVDALQLQTDVADGDPPRCSCFPWCRIFSEEHEKDDTSVRSHHLVLAESAGKLA